MCCSRGEPGLQVPAGRAWRDVRAQPLGWVVFVTGPVAGLRLNRKASNGGGGAWVVAGLLSVPDDVLQLSMT